MCLYVFKKNSVIIVGKVRLDIAVLPQRNQTNRYFDSFVDVYFFYMDAKFSQNIAV